MNTPKSYLRSTSLQWIIKHENLQTDSRKNNDWGLKIHLNTSLRKDWPLSNEYTVNWFIKYCSVIEYGDLNIILCNILKNVSKIIKWILKCEAICCVVEVWKCWSIIDAGKLFARPNALKRIMIIITSFYDNTLNVHIYLSLVLYETSFLFWSHTN